MSKCRTLRVLVNARLTAAAEDIFALIERTIAEYEEELCRSKEENQRKQQLLDSVLTLSPTVLQLRAASALFESRLPVSPHTYDFTTTATASVQIPSVPPLTVPDLIKDEQSVKQEEQLQVLDSPSSGVYMKKEESSLLQQIKHRVETQGEDSSSQRYVHLETEGEAEHSCDTDNNENWGALFSCSAAQMETEADGDHYNQVQIRARSSAAQNSGPSSKYKRAPETSDTVDNGDVSGTAEKRKTHQCSLCNKRFARNRNLQIHLRLHSGERPHSCSFCNKTFAQIGALNYHLVTHTGEIPLSCPICKKGFRISSHLKAHMTTHTGEKPYSCSFCKKSFSQKAHLTVHRRIHTGEKPFSCSLCDRSFARLDGLRSHMATHK